MLVTAVVALAAALAAAVSIAGRGIGWPSAVACFWTALALLAYTFVGYGGMVWAAARLRPRRIRWSSPPPTVSVVVVAHNEATRIVGRIENLLAVDYPRDRIEIIIASDGSTDETVARARTFEPRVRTVAFSERRGKPPVLNEVVPTVRGDIVVLADARQRFDRTAIAALVEAFADPGVGVVSGELMLLKHGEGDAAAEGSAVYWDYEKVIRRSESQLDSTVGATGAIYAIRRELFERIPNDTVLDDVVIPLRIMRRGYRITFEPKARAYDSRVATAREEYTRKVRTIAGNFQLFARERWVFNPFSNRLWVQTLSHKGLRLVVPLFYLVAFTANAMLLDVWLYRWTMAGQVGFCAAALAVPLLPGTRRKLPLLNLPYTVCFMGWTTVVAFVRYLSGRQQVTWDRVSPSLRVLGRE